MTNPTRNIASLIRVDNGNVVSVKTAAPIPKGKIFACMQEIRAATATAPVRAGDVLLENVAGTGVDVVATANVTSSLQSV
jgi:CxxC motif-containing protein